MGRRGLRVLHHDHRSRIAVVHPTEIVTPRDLPIIESIPPLPLLFLLILIDLRSPRPFGTGIGYKRFLFFLLEVSQFEYGSRAATLNQLLRLVEIGLVFFFILLLVLQQKLLVKGNHLLDVGLEIIFVASVLDVHLLYRGQFVHFYMGVFYTVF